VKRVCWRFRPVRTADGEGGWITSYGTPHRLFLDFSLGPDGRAVAVVRRLEDVEVEDVILILHEERNAP